MRRVTNKIESRDSMIGVKYSPVMYIFIGDVAICRNSLIPRHDNAPSKNPYIILFIASPPAITDLSIPTAKITTSVN